MRFNDRVLAVGDTRSGKSELLAHLANRARVQRVLIDPKGEWVAGQAPMHHLSARTPEAAAAEVDAIDWTAPIVHVQPAPLERHQLEALYDRIDRIHRPVVVWTDELMDVSTGSWAPRGLARLQTTGAARRHGSLAATQRPIAVSMAARSQWTHLFVSRDIGADDLRDLLGWAPFVQEFEPAVPELVRSLEPYAFVWIDKPARTVTVVDPLPAGARAGGPFRKRPGFDSA